MIGDTSGPVLGSNLTSLLENARKHKKEMGDAFVSVEHLVLAFFSDNRFGVRLFRNLKLSEKDLKDAVQAVRGSQRVTDQSTDLTYFYLMAICIFHPMTRINMGKCSRIVVPYFESFNSPVCSFLLVPLGVPNSNGRCISIT